MTSYKATDVYDSARDRIEAVFAEQPSPSQLTQRLCQILNEVLPTYTWVGIYLVAGDDLVLDAWQGPAPTEHIRIPIGTGVCGAAAATRETIIVPDVNEDPRYLQCFLATRSEIVVPIKHQEQVVGEIDVDSDELNAFGAADTDLLEDIARRLGATLGNRTSH